MFKFSVCTSFCRECRWIKIFNTVAHFIPIFGGVFSPCLIASRARPGLVRTGPAVNRFAASLIVRHAAFSNDVNQDNSRALLTTSSITWLHAPSRQINKVCRNNKNPFCGARDSFVVDLHKTVSKVHGSAAYYFHACMCPCPSNLCRSLLLDTCDNIHQACFPSLCNWYVVYLISGVAIRTGPGIQPPWMLFEHDIS